MSDTNIQECCEHGTPYIVDCKRCKDDELPASDSSALERKLTKQGVFKGHHGLEGLLNSQEFWDNYGTYGTRLYYGDGITDYLHRGVLGAAVEILKQNTKSQEREASSAQDCPGKE